MITGHITSPPRRFTGCWAIEPQAHDRACGARLDAGVRQSPTRRQLRQRLVLQRAHHEADRCCVTHSRNLAVVTGGAGFIGSHMVDRLLESGYRARVIDNLVGGRESNLAQHANNPDLAFERADIRNLESNAALFADAAYVFHFAGIGDIVPSIERPTEYMATNVQGTVQGSRGCAHRRGAKVRLCSLFILLWDGRDADPRGSSDRTAISIRTVQIYGRAGGVALASSLRLASQFDSDFQCLWHAGAHHRRLWRRVRGVL